MNKSEALKILFLCAEQYHKNLENTNLLLICANSSMNKVIAVKMQFEAKNFLHLTYRKGRKEERYSEIVYKARKIELSKIKFPKEYEYLTRLE